MRNGDCVELSNGHKVDAAFGIIGIGADLGLFSGWDDNVGYMETVDGNYCRMTYGDVVLLCDEAIKRWEAKRAYAMTRLPNETYDPFHMEEA